MMAMMTETVIPVTARSPIDSEINLIKKIGLPDIGQSLIFN